MIPELPSIVALVCVAIAAYQDYATGRIHEGISAVMVGFGLAANGLGFAFNAAFVIAIGVIEFAHLKQSPFKFGDVLLFAGLAALVPQLWVLSTFALSVVFLWVWTKTTKPRSKRVRFAPFILGALAVVLTVANLM